MIKTMFRNLIEKNGRGHVNSWVRVTHKIHEDQSLRTTKIPQYYSCTVTTHFEKLCTLKFFLKCVKFGTKSTHFEKKVRYVGPKFNALKKQISKCVDFVPNLTHLKKFQSALIWSQI